MRCPHCGGYIVEPAARAPAPLTVRQREMYEFVYWSVDARGYGPSFDEIAEFFNYSSIATVHEHLSNLERKGWISRRYNEARAITCLVALKDSAAVETPAP